MGRFVDQRRRRPMYTDEDVMKASDAPPASGAITGEQIRAPRSVPNRMYTDVDVKAASNAPPRAGAITANQVRAPRSVPENMNTDVDVLRGSNAYRPTKPRRPFYGNNY